MILCRNMCVRVCESVIYISKYINLILRELCRRLCAECVSSRRWQGGTSEKQDALLHRLAADGTALDLVAAHLAGAMATQEDHILDAIEANRTHGLQIEIVSNLSHKKPSSHSPAP